MLDKIIMFPFVFFLIFLLIFLGVIGIIMFGQWIVVQNEAQFVATSMGKFGGYTVDAEDRVVSFAHEKNLNRTQVNVEVSNISPAPYGKSVWAKVTIPFQFRLGEYNVGTFQLTGIGNSVSSYIYGAYDASYVSP